MEKGQLISDKCDWLLKQARLQDEVPLVDIAMQAGRIAAIGPRLTVAAAETWDVQGCVVLPGLVDAHTHLDKTYITTQNKSGTLLEAIAVWRSVKNARTLADIQASARQALRAAIANGVTAMRSHIDTFEAQDLVAVEALLRLREEMRHLIELQFVALGNPGGSQEEQATLRQALAMGVDLIGGAPALNTDPQHTINAAFALAEDTGKAIDLHIDETEDPTMLSLAYLADQTIVHGLQGQVTAGHCCSLAFVEPSIADRVLDKVAQAQLNLITLPSCNLVLMGRQMQPVPRGITRVKEALARQIGISAASDNVHDPFNPFGNYDLLQIANLTAHVAHLSGEAEIATCLHIVTTHPARTLGLTDYGLHIGAAADLVVLNTDSLKTAILAPPARLATFKVGRLVVRTEITRHWEDEFPQYQ